VDVCREIRSWSRAPIVVLSARHSDEEKVQLLNTGADDYVTKPFSAPEFAARVRAQLRRSRLPATEAVPTVINAYGLTIDLMGRRVTRRKIPIRLTPIEWEILRTLISNADRTLTHQQSFEANPARPELIVTEPGVGYRAELPS